MGQVQATQRNSNITQRSFSTNKNEEFYNKNIQHEGLLKLRKVPFKNCIEIQTQSQSLFLQNVQITLKDLLQSRLYTNKLFPKQDIERLIQNITYTLAFLQQNNIPYKDVSSQNIFYDQGSFKLLPNALISDSRYKKFQQYHRKYKQSHIQNKLLTQTQTKTKTQQFITLAPEMIIAFRCKQQFITDVDILDKSNVFYMGLLLLQVATLLPACQCYDIQTYDILDDVINERIQLVKQYYSDEIASIIANMLDYDYAQRMNLKQLSIFVNRQFNREITANSKISKQLSSKKSNSIPIQPVLISQQHNEETQNRFHNTQSKITTMTKSRLQNIDQNESRMSKPSQSGSNLQKKKNKTNKIYINNGFQEEEQQSTFMREDRNKVYMKSSKTAENQKAPLQDTLNNQRLKSSLLPINTPSNSSIGPSRVRQTSGKFFNATNARQKFVPSIPQYNIKSRSRINNQEDQQNRYPTEQIYKKPLRRKDSSDYLGYRANNTVKTPKQQNYHHQNQKFEIKDDYQPPQNNYRQKNLNRTQNEYSAMTRKQGAFVHKYAQKQPSNYQINEDSGSRGYFKVNRESDQSAQNYSHNQQDYKEHDHSLNRIKSEIQRSRKLIQEFKRGQKCQF